MTHPDARHPSARRELPAVALLPLFCFLFFALALYLAPRVDSYRAARVAAVEVQS